MKTIIRISEDIQSTLCWDMKKEDITYLVNEIDIFCEVRNNNFGNIIEDEKRYSSNKEDYKNSIEINAIGYSQSDWQDFTIYYNESEFKTAESRMYLSSLIKHLQNYFTHDNNYFVEKFDRTEIDGKTFDSEVYDMAFFYVDNIEFPKKEDILTAYENNYGKDYDEIIINN